MKIYNPICFLFAIVLFSFYGMNSNETDNKLYLCFHNCALCVIQWEVGLYNGEKCAKKCLKFRSNPRIVDPDCNTLKFFNYSFIKRRAKKLNQS